MKLGTETLLYQIPSVSPPLRQHHHHPPCIMFWNTNIIPMHNMTTGKLGTEILLHQIPSVPPPLRQYHHHPPCIMFWNTNIIPIHNMTTGKFLNRSLTENWPAVGPATLLQGLALLPFLPLPGWHQIHVHSVTQQSALTQTPPPAPRFEKNWNLKTCPSKQARGAAIWIPRGCAARAWSL